MSLRVTKAGSYYFVFGVIEHQQELEMAWDVFGLSSIPLEIPGFPAKLLVLRTPETPESPGVLIGKGTSVSWMVPIPEEH